MTMTSYNGDDLERLVVDTRQRLRRNAVITGSTLVVAAALGWLTAGAVVDILLPLPVVLRIAVACGFWLILLAALAMGVAWPALQPLRLDRVAYRIERTVPRMHNRLITVLDLRSRTTDADATDAFVDRLIDQTRHRLSSYRIEHVASTKPARRGAIGAASVAVIIAVLLIALGDQMATAVVRILRPTAPIAPVSWVKLNALSGDLRVLQGEPVVIRATVERGEVDQLLCRLRPVGGKWISYHMQPASRNAYTFTISEVNESYVYQIAGGKTWTVPRQITMVRRPIVEKLDAAVQLPAYMELPEPQPVDERDKQINAPISSQIILSATVAGDVARGRIELYKPAAGKAEKRTENEIVWFDDEFPLDAQIIGRCRWITEEPYSGTKAHTFDWSRKAYGFASRLDKLTVKPDSSLFVYVRPDPHDPPQTLTVTFTEQQGTHKLVWQADADGSEDTVRKMPTPGQWTRLEVPIKQLKRKKPDQPAHLTGMEFEIDSGRIYFDRTGALRRSSDTIEDRRMEQTGSIAMQLDQTTGHWVGQVPVEADGFVSVRFYNALDYPSRVIPPLQFLATTDQAPTVLIEKPGKNVTLTEPQPVPLMVRAFDDYGVKSVAIQSGGSADKLGEPRQLTAYDTPRNSQLAMAVLDPAKCELQPGQTLYYRLLVYDYKDQSTPSETMKLTLAKPTQVKAGGAKPKSTLIKSLLDGISGLVSEQDKFIGVSSELLGSLFTEDQLAPIQSQGVITLVNPDGTPMTAEQVRKLLFSKWAHLTKEQAEHFEILNERLGKQEQALRALSADLAASAEAARQSPTAMADEAQMLQAMADRADQLGKMLEQMRESDDVLENLVEAQGMLPTLQTGVGDLEQQLQDMADARQMLTDEPYEAQQRMAALMSLTQTRDTTVVMDDLAETLQMQQEQLAALQQQLDPLQQQVEGASAEELEKISRQQ